MATWPGWSKENTLVLPVDAPVPTASLELDGRRFVPKDELHLTLVGRALGAELRRLLGDRLDAATRPAFEALDWSFERSGRPLLVERTGTTDDGEAGRVASVIEPVELPALDYYYLWLGSLVGRQLPVPPAHLTLYTFRKAEGIGIPNARSLRSWARREVDLPG